MAAPPGQGSLSVIALISGGKDSFYSLLHCQANGHRVVALANLYPSGSAEEPVVGAGRSLSPPSQQDGHSAASTRPRLETAGARSRHSEIAGEGEGETDLNSFMYQTVGHQIVPLYARATGLPLHRQPIVGTAVHSGLNYENPRRNSRGLVPSDGSALRTSLGHFPSATDGDPQGLEREQADDGGERQPRLEPDRELEDETESLVPLLRSVLAAHPEANALCTGAILSTYQRTRVESVAIRLGLVPLSYLWQFTELPPSLDDSCYDQNIGLAARATKGNANGKKRHAAGGQELARDDARLLRDMAAVGLEARIVKVASAGLDEDFLWENVASEKSVQRVDRAMRRFGAAGGRGSILGEGGEFETLVVDGPPSLFKGRIVISDDDKRVVREGGGCAWLSFRQADVVLKDEPEQAGASSQADALNSIRIPGLLDPRFADTLQCLLADTTGDENKLGLLHLASSRDSEPGPNLGPESSWRTTVKAGFPKCQMSLSNNLSSEEWVFLGSDEPSRASLEEQTVSIVDQVRRCLESYRLPATAISNSVIVLRHMSDFPVVNKHYGSLFHEPNPPSRVTISCGDKLLPQYAHIAVYLTVQLGLQPDERRGLHVQSRSYWAPANIGPYSQAVAFPLLPQLVGDAAKLHDGELEQPLHSSSSPFAVAIAGQIPLLPASMELPSSSEPNSVELQITLALQHLWRVGIEMKVRWWTSAVAYFPVASSTDVMRHQALLAATAWKAAHLWPDLDQGNVDEELDASDDDEEDDAGPDLWDRRYNAQYMTHGDEDEPFPLSLPNWSVLEHLNVPVDESVGNSREGAKVLLRKKAAAVPFFFAAEVEELPRQAGVEWHAHLGLAEIPTGSITFQSASIMKHTEDLTASEHLVVIDAGDAVFVQTICAIQPPAHDADSQKATIAPNVLRSVARWQGSSLRKLLNLSEFPKVKPKITYVEVLSTTEINKEWLTDNENPNGFGNKDPFGELGPLIPCHSLWDSQGRRLVAVCIFETRLPKAK
ncbi:hypothetical protein F4808DRAFT_356928 [Astrocystis sublimbata]|nr:hypothetical protein F4808DRAFT_356928 [Astrocystis sublimbata]